ncbi:putative phage tail tape measure protein [Escherichia coli]|uniref:Putative phage tail tape measure protein n=1 Tax=Escherichia coli TaxID=562 RepID=A0A376P3G2_ECOLX|nr:putative phage tail tape measure protein [Escherichia coli]
MADVRKVVDGLDTPEAFKAMTEQVRDLSTELPMSAEGIAEIVAAGGQAGIARDELMQFTDDAVKMGVAFGHHGRRIRSDDGAVAHCL